MYNLLFTWIFPIKHFGFPYQILSNSNGILRIFGVFLSIYCEIMNILSKFWGSLETLGISCEIRKTFSCDSFQHPGILVDHINACGILGVCCGILKKKKPFYFNSRKLFTIDLVSTKSCQLCSQLNMIMTHFKFFKPFSILSVPHSGIKKLFVIYCACACFNNSS